MIAQEDDPRFLVVPAPPFIAKTLYKVAHLDHDVTTFAKLFVRHEGESTVLIATDLHVAFAARAPRKLAIEPGDYRFYHKNVKYGIGETHMLVRFADPPIANVLSLFVDPGEREQIGTCYYKAYLRLSTFASFRINVNYLKLLPHDLLTVYTDRRPTRAPRYQFEAEHIWPITYLVMGLDPAPGSTLNNG